MFARFFIDKPVFSWVVAIIIMLAGTASILSLPIAQYPDIAPPTVSISANYSGADAQTVENSVTQVLEQQLTVWMVYCIFLPPAHLREAPVSR